MAHQNYAEESKKNYGRDESAAFSHDDLQLGCLQRIAKATETISQSYNKLIEERDLYKKLYGDERACTERLLRRISAMKGVITRLQRKVKK